MVPAAVANTPPLSKFTTRFISTVKVPPVVWEDPPKINEFTNVGVSIPTAAVPARIVVPPKIQLFAVPARMRDPPERVPALTSVEKFRGLTPR
jgi:hypothetical protein